MSIIKWITTLSVIQIIGMSFVALAAGALVGFLHRTYMNSRVPFYAPIIVGLGTVGLLINSASALITFVAHAGEPVGEPLVIQNMNTNIVTAVIATIAAYGGGRIGDSFAPSVSALVGAKQIDREISKVVRAVGRMITVTIPTTINDMDGYEAVPQETKDKLAGKELVFPRGLTVEELRERIITRLQEDYGVGYVDVDISVEGKITYLAIGSRTSGLGPSLPPRRVAVAVSANPAPQASPGDRVQLWELPESAEETPSEVSEVDDIEFSQDDTADDTTDSSHRLHEEDELPGIFNQFPDKWYRPDSHLYQFAVRTPFGNRRYFETVEGAERLLRRLYAGSKEANQPKASEDGSTKQEGRAVAHPIGMGELWATAGDVATLVVDRNQLNAIDQSKTYAMVTLPDRKNADREFASLLRVANETMESIRVKEGSPLDGIPIEAIQSKIIAIKPQTGPLEILPDPGRLCKPGDKLFVIGRHDEMRKLQDGGSA